jgi:hypothetical protein
MLDLVHAAVSILNGIATWRFVVALLAAGVLAFLASLFVDAGPLLAWTTWSLLAIGAIFGLLWQYRHEKPTK